MNKLRTSDEDPTMAAKRTFDNILTQILSSNLNFHLQISPFSANISLKKSPKKDKSGAPCAPVLPSPTLPACPSPTLAAFAAENLKLEDDLAILKSDYKNAVEDSKAAHLRIKFLESQSIVKLEKDEGLHKELLEKNDLVTSLKLEIANFNKIKENYESVIENHEEEIKYLENANKKANKISETLKRELHAEKAKFSKEKEKSLKEHRAEVKGWRNDLGEETKEKIKLEKELFKVKEILNKSSSVLVSTPAVDKKPANIKKSADSKNSDATENSKDTIENPEEIVCTICAAPIVNYVKKYCLGEAFSPACDKCDDNSWISESEDETDVGDAHVDFRLNDIEEQFEEFLRNFRSKENSPKYEILALELVKSNEITLDVSIADVRIYNNSLMDLINGMDYKGVFRHLCYTLLRFVKTKDPDLSSKKLLVRLVP